MPKSGGCHGSYRPGLKRFVKRFAYDNILLVPQLIDLQTSLVSNHVDHIQKSDGCYTYYNYDYQGYDFYKWSFSRSMNLYEHVDEE